MHAEAIELHPNVGDGVHRPLTCYLDLYMTQPYGISGGAASCSTG
jgi:hypothetical protein